LDVVGGYGTTRDLRNVLGNLLECVLSIEHLRNAVQQLGDLDIALALAVEQPGRIDERALARLTGKLDALSQTRFRG
jgi:hypothetical protein